MAYYKVRIEVWCDWNPAESDLDDIAQAMGVGEALRTKFLRPGAEPPWETRPFPPSTPSWVNGSACSRLSSYLQSTLKLSWNTVVVPLALIVFEAAKRRKPDEFGNDPKPYFLYIDEFQNFISIDLGDMLDQVAKRGLFTILAHQRFGQLDEDIIDAALTNCHIKAVFGGLPFKTARLLAEELAIIDTKKVKAAIYQTKFWPTYERDTVYTRGSTRGTSSGLGRHSASGSSSSEFFDGQEWFPTSGLSNVDGSSSMDGESSAESESEADIPIFVPVPFKELSSVQHYTPEEQFLEFAAALKHQFQRHCFIKIHQRETQPMLVPFVEEFSTPQHNLAWYIDKLFKAEKALPAADVDRLLKERDAALEELATKPRVVEDYHD